MFIWDFLADDVLGDVFDWIYGKIVEFLGEFLTMMNGMGTELFELIWVQGIVEFFRCFGWALYGVGIVVAVFEATMEYQSGRSTAVRDVAMGILKGFLAASLFSTVPVELYKLCIDLQGSLSTGIAGASHTDGVSSMAMMAMSALNGYGVFVTIFLLILMGYSIIKIFFANLKRGGILLIQIAVGSLYLFSVGYIAMTANWAGNSDKTIHFFNPGTLMKDFVAEETYWEQHRREQFMDWVDGHDLDFCCRKVKEAWEKQR